MSTLESLRSLVANGVAKRFDLRAWSSTSACDVGTSAVDRLEHVFSQARPDALKLMVMESLQGTAQADADVSVYGETVVRPFLDFLTKRCRDLALERGKARVGGDAATTGTLRFHDLGSGAGKSVLTAALCSHFSECRGIELLPCLHAVARCLVEDFHRDVAPRDDGSTPRASVELGDVFENDSWLASDVVFCNCVTWDDVTMTRLAAMAENMSPGSLFVTVLAPLESASFEVVAEDEIDFSWGTVEAIVHRRR